MALTQIKTDLIANSAVTQSKIDPNVELGGAAVTTSATAPTSPTPSTGDLWYNTTNGKLSVYYNSGWVVTQLDQQGIGSRVVDVFTATASQTVFTTSAGYSVGYVDVYVNGIKLLPADFTATNATTVTLGSGADVSDEVVIISWTLAPGIASFVSDIFTGNGSQTVYSLSTTPSHENQTTVVIDGVTQVRNTYSVSGASLTFSEAPGSGSVIEITTAKASGVLTTSYNDLTDKPDLTGLGIKISNIQVTDSGGTVLDDTAVDIAGGYIKLTGAGFLTGCQVLVNNVPATSTTFVSSTVVRAQVPATAAGTYIVYLVNPDGGVGIRVNGVTFSSTPSWVTGSSLSGAVDSAISIQLDATGASTFTLQAGSTLPAGLSLSSGGLLSGTVTGLTQDTVYSFVVLATDAENQDSPRTFNISISLGDPYFNITSLAINADTDIFVRDGSNNNFNVTITGSTAPTVLSPYNNVWSNHFDGTGDYLTIPYNSAWDFGTGNFTIESWVYPTTSGTVRVIAASFTNSGNDGWSLELTTGNLLTFYAESSYAATSSATVPVNTWTHVAVCRSGSTLKLFVNGVESASVSYSTSIAGFSGLLAISGTQSGTALFTGYQSNFRIVTGSAVYTSAFTPSTTPLTAITNTSLLTCKSNRFIDNSTNAFTITIVGDTKVTNFGPFVETNTSGSTYFDTTASGLTVASNTELNLGTGDFTIEGWYYSNASDSTFNSAFYLGTINGANALGLAVSDTSIAYRSAGSSDRINVSSLNLKRSWNHIALVRASGTTKIYLNGTAVGSPLSDPTSYSSSGNLIFSRPDSTTYRYAGYIADFRIVKGTAVYTANFTPPTAQLTAVSGTSLLTMQGRHGINNHTFISNSAFYETFTKSGSPSQGSFSPFSPAGWSNYFDGTGDYLTFSATSTQLIGQATLTSTSTFTAEAWIYPTASSGTSNAGVVIGDMQATGAGNHWCFGLNSSNLITFYWYDGAQKSCSGAAVQLNIWSHIAVSISSGTIKMFINGVLQTLTGTTTLTSATGSNNAYSIGSYNNSSFNGYISNLRVVKSALYSTTFTPSNTSINAITDTSLLTCKSNRFIDISTNNFVITTAGDVRVVNFSPLKPTEQWSSLVHGGSMYLDGDDTLDITGSTRLGLTGAFTIEFWYYQTTLPEYGVVFELNSYQNGILFRPGSGGNGLLWVNGSQVVTGTTSPPVINRWRHVVITRNSANSMSLFLDGSRIWNATITGSINSSNGQLRFGGALHTTGQYWTGYVSNFKLTNGFNFYDPTQSTITVPTGITNNVNASLLLDYNYPAVVDLSSRNVLGTLADARTITSAKKFGTGSMYFDGTGDYLASYSELTKLNCTFRTGNFTIEMWINFATVGTNLGIVDVYSGTSGAGAGPWYLYRLSTNVIGFGIHGAGPIVSSTTNTAASTWYHVAVTRSGTSLRLFVNGVLESSATNSSDLVASGLQLGLISTPYLMNGYIDDFRITKGFARYTANFTPPTATFLVK